jgi:CHAT domain-containing protein
MIDTMGSIYLGHFRLALLTMHSPAKAFEIVEYARGRALADSMRSHTATLKAGIAQTVPDLELARVQGQLRRSSNTPDETKRLLTRLDHVYDALAPIDYARDRAEVAALVMPVSLAALQKSLHPDEALIEYVLSSGKNSYVFEITSTRIQVHMLPPRERVENLAQAFVKAVRSRADSSELAKQLFETTVAPVLSSHPKSVVIVPDGSLHLVPFASLRDDHGQYWVKSVQIASAPSATVFYSLRSTRQIATASRPFLGVAFSPAESVSISAKASTTREASFGDHPLDLKPLPYAEEEVTAAAQVLGKGSMVLTGNKASEGSLKSEPLSEFDIIHVAAHGVSDLVEPDRAGLVLAPEGGSEDGFWQAREIRRAKLSADLVTLSACETGTGRLYGEEGVMNLARSFLVAGAKSVVASLWDADDRMTATLMTHFYRHIAASETVAESLRSAQTELLTEFGEDAKPYFWSGFTVIGDGTRKIVLQTRAAQPGTTRQNLR